MLLGCTYTYALIVHCGMHLDGINLPVVTAFVASTIAC